MNFVCAVSATRSIGYSSVSLISIISTRVRAVMRGLTGALLNVLQWCVEISICRTMRGLLAIAGSLCLDCAVVIALK